MDWKAELRELMELRAQGGLTEAQFEAERDELMKRRGGGAAPTPAPLPTKRCSVGAVTKLASSELATDEPRPPLWWPTFPAQWMTSSPEENTPVLSATVAFFASVTTTSSKSDATI